MYFVDPQTIPSTGNPVIDAHHRHIARAVNSVYEQWKSWDRLPGAAFEIDLTQVLREVEIHLTSEEIITRGAGFEEWKSHRSLHDALRTRMRDVAGFQDGAWADETALLEAFDFFDHLIFQHEFLDDQEFWETFRRHSERAPCRPDLVAWDSRLHLGEEGADWAHRTLVESLNGIHQAILDRVDCGRVGSLFDDFRALWLGHLVEEGVPDDTVAILRVDLEHARRHCSRGDCQGTGAFLVNQARFWLIDHITHRHGRQGRLP
jgi:hemerythrin-like metal-binding protein